jgi:aryl-alcohol dehydrogenase-like predicted oxidoreductase
MPAQLALAWLLNQRDDIFAMCVTRKLDCIDEDAKAIGVELNAEVLRDLAQACFARPWFVARSGVVQGVPSASSAASRSCMNAS